jgi:hypothetical protein
MHPVLQTLMVRISREIDGLDEGTAQLHPDEQAHQWSVQQIVEHLALSYRTTTRNLEARLAKGRVTRNQRRSLVEWALQLMVLSFGHHPRGAPPLEEASASAGPFPAKNGSELAELLRGELEAMDGVLDRCRRKFGMERVAVHPILGPLRVDQWRRFHTVYGMHYLQQIVQVRDKVRRQAVPAGDGRAKLAEELPIPGRRSLT